MDEPKRVFGRFQIVLAVVLLAAIAAVYLFPAMNILSIPIGAAAFVGLCIIGRLNDDPPDY